MVIRADSEMVFQNIRKRPRNCHKGDFGRALLIVGSEQFIGAAMICSRAAYRSGCGYCFTASLPRVLDQVIAHVPEVCLIELRGNQGHVSSENVPVIRDRIAQMTAVGFGCGLTANEDTDALLTELLKLNKPMVIDADGLNDLAQDMDRLRNKNCQVVLTPHEGEFYRLTGIDIRNADNKAEVLKQFADEYGVTVLLKGCDTLIASHDCADVYLLDNGTPGMAKAGSGDALTGIITSLLAQGITPVKAAACGAWIHNEAGTIASRKYSVNGMLVSDLIECIPEVFLKYDR